MYDLRLSSRFLPDSSTTTYFGYPAWHAYGNMNTNPTYGGLIYGSYLKTHNINPHAGKNNPEATQVHNRAILGGTANVKAPGKPRPPWKDPAGYVLEY